MQYIEKCINLKKKNCKPEVHLDGDRKSMVGRWSAGKFEFDLRLLKITSDRDTVFAVAFQAKGCECGLICACYPEYYDCGVCLGRD